MNSVAGNTKSGKKATQSVYPEDYRVALVHYWLVGMRGGERVLEALCEMFPQADIFTHVHVPEAISETINRHKIRTTFIGRLPAAARLYKRYLPLMPIALEQLDLRDYDLVISSESGPAKGVIVPPDAVHICYCHTPMRYLWNMYHDYRVEAGSMTRTLMPPLAHYLRVWDFASAARVDHFIANSANTAGRIWSYYRRQADVVYPPVDTNSFAPADEREDFYLFVGELVPYKRADLAVNTFNELGLPLVVIGGGEQLENLRKLALSNVQILGPQPFEVLRDHYARCKALVFPGEEDFGIVPVEAMASGTPVIAFGRGGALETVVENKTGLFFFEPTTTSLSEAVKWFEASTNQFDRKSLLERANYFKKSRFQSEVKKLITMAINAKKLRSQESKRINIDERYFFVN